MADHFSGVDFVAIGTLPFTLLEGTTPPEDANQANVWIVTDSVPIRLTPYTDPTCVSPPCADEMHSPKLSSDGTLVAYTDFDPGGSGAQCLYVVPVDGSATYPLTEYYNNTTGDWMNHPCWSPTDDKIVFTDSAPEGAFTGGTLGGAIREVTYPGGVDTVLWTPQGQTPQRENANAPQYSPDGTKIMFFVTLDPGGGGDYTRQGLWVMDADGSNDTHIDAWVTVNDTESGYLFSGTQGAWSHDSEWIAYVDRGFGGGPSTSGTFSVWKIRPDGTDKTLLADGSGGTIRHYIAHDAWLPDDSAVICTEKTGAGRLAILQAAADGSGTTEIVANTDGPYGTQNFETAIRDFRSNRINWVYDKSANPVIIRTSQVNGLDMQDTYAPVDSTVGSGSGFEWI